MILKKIFEDEAMKFFIINWLKCFAFRGCRQKAFLDHALVDFREYYLRLQLMSVYAINVFYDLCHKGKLATSEDHLLFK